MTVRIAFTACSKVNFDPEQRVWREIEQYKPQHLMLLGDQIYMDYLGDDDGPDGFIGYKLGEPARDSVSVEEFEDQMQLRYRQQFAVASFRTLVHAIGQRHGSVEVVWDDHDFGFNNSLGLSGGPSDDEFQDHLMPAAKKQVSRRLFEEFRWNVRQLLGDSSAAYRTLPDHLAPATDPFPGVQSKLSLDGVDIFLLDTRSFRQSPARKSQPWVSSILGDKQWQWLSDGLANTDNKLAIIAAGSPLSSKGAASDQSWKQAKGHQYKPYREYDQLLALAGTMDPAQKQLLFIGGDRHTAVVVDEDPPLPEFVCAGAAAPKGVFNSNGRHFCLVDVDDQSRAIVRLFEKGKEDDTWPDGAPPLPTVTSMGAIAAEVAHAALPSETVHVKTAQVGTVHGEPLQGGAGLRFSDLFLITDREVLDHNKTTDEADTRLHYFRFAGDRAQGKASRLKHWETLDADTFWALVRESADRLRQLNPANLNQICLFIPGNRESSDTAIAQYRALNDIAFNAQGGQCIGTCILFDWATRMGHFQFTEIYRENIRRAENAGAWLTQILQSAHEVSRAAATQLAVVAHSLGNRVALPALARMPADAVDRYYASAADLARDAFDSVQGRAAVQACRAVLVPYTAKDFVLSYAESAEPGTRLGRSGPQAPVPARLHAKDLSNVVSSADPHGGLFWFPWPGSEDAGPLQTAFFTALVRGDWG